MPVETLWTLLDRIGPPAAAGPAASRRLAVHDSCTTRHEPQIHASVRNLLARLGHEVEELPYNHDNTVCCGYGGLMMFADREVARKVVNRRVRESETDYLTYCAMCRDNFAGRGKRAIYLLDLLSAPDRENMAERPAPGYRNVRRTGHGSNGSCSGRYGGKTSRNRLPRSMSLSPTTSSASWKTGRSSSPTWCR
jgi:hypothetical protein